MESDSDWDSISGGGPDVGDVSVSVAAESSRQQKRTPRPPLADRNASPVVNKAPLQKTNLEYRNPQRVAEQYRNQSNSGKAQGVTVFKDTGGITLDSEDFRSSRKNTPTPQQPHQANFQEVEMKESPLKYNMFQAATENRRRSQLKDSNENLPYTEFEASDVPPRKNDPPYYSPVRKNPHPEYVLKSPTPEAANVQPHIKPANRTQQRQGSFQNERQNVDKKSKRKSKVKRESVIINENANVFDSDDTEKDFSWKDHQNPHHHDEVKDGDKHVQRDVILKTSNQVMLLEERYEYENAVRDYHSIYIENQAKLPVVADKLESMTRRGVQEFFGALQILFDFIIIFLVELLRFLLKQFGRKLIAGTITAAGDFLIKPVLTALFNGIVQPLFVLTWNVMYGLRKLLDPLLSLTRELFTQVAMLLRAFRLVDVNSKSESRLQSV